MFSCCLGFFPWLEGIWKDARLQKGMQDVDDPFKQNSLQVWRRCKFNYGLLLIVPLAVWTGLLWMQDDTESGLHMFGGLREYYKMELGAPSDRVNPCGSSQAHYKTSILRLSLYNVSIFFSWHAQIHSRLFLRSRCDGQARRKRWRHYTVTA